MKKVIGLMALGLSMILLSGCGSDDNNDTPPVPQSIQGTVVGSHYEGAWVCVDANSNDRCDGEETITVSDANGNWTLDDPHNSTLSVVAEIYVDNIKHSNYPAPPTATLVEKPMIFIAPLQGEVGNQLIVSPISTMVYRSMQENGTSFEVARESVANELGVSSDTLLTNYNVENPSADHIAMQERSDVETEKLGLSMTYHSNVIDFLNEGIEGGRYTVLDFYIPSAQDPDHHIKIGTVVNLRYFVSDSVVTGELDFVLGRSASSSVAGWWGRRVSSNQNNRNSEPGKLNFAMKGDLTIVIGGKSYVFLDFFIAQGHNETGNNWWIGSRSCNYIYSDNLTCSSIDESGNTVKFKFENVNTNFYYEISKVD